MGEKTILEQKVDTIMEWIKKQDDERCKKVVIGTFGRNSLRELIYDACDATGLSITEEESKKINRKLKEIIDKNLTETTEEIMKAIKEVDAETYKNICTRKVPFLDKIKIFKKACPKLNSCSVNEFKEINNRMNKIINKNSEEVLKIVIEKIVNFYNTKENKDSKDVIDKIIQESAQNIEENKLAYIINQIDKGTLNLDDAENQQYIDNLLKRIEEESLGTRADMELFEIFKGYLKGRLIGTAKDYIEKIKVKAEKETDMEIKEKYMLLYKKIYEGTISKEEITECFDYLELMEKNDATIKICTEIKNWINYMYIHSIYIKK